MMRKKIKSALLISGLIAAFSFGSILPARAVDTMGALGVGLTVLGCNNNGTCDSGETFANCPNDCPCDYNGTCDWPRETAANCSDCVCNNNRTCDPWETASCADCVVVPPPIDIPLTINASVSGITDSSAVIDWMTNYSATCVVSWGEGTDYASGASAETASLLAHSLPIGSLKPETLYHFNIACSNNKHGAATGDRTFSTLTSSQRPPISAVMNLTADPGDQHIYLTWENPDQPYFAGVSLRRSTVRHPTLTQGVEVYRGPGIAFDNTGLTNGVRYYYSAFAFDDQGNYSSGALADAVPFGQQATSTPPATTTPPVEPPTINTTTPPVVTPPTGSQYDLKFRDFDFFQINQALSVQPDDNVNSQTSLPLTLELQNFKALPGTDRMVLQTQSPELAGSYLFDYNPTTQRYSITLPSIKNKASINATIIVLNAAGQEIKRVYGRLTFNGQEVAPIAPILPLAIPPQLQAAANSPAGKAIAVFTAIVALANLLMAVPWWNLWYLLQLFFSQPLFLLWRRKGWGVVYNSITKRPVDLALVRLYEAATNRLVTSRVTDRYGRFIFLASRGNYYITVEKPQFAFPCKLLKFAPDDGKYGELYYGERISVDVAQAAIIPNIPLDPIEQMVDNKTAIRQVSRAQVYRISSWIGPMLALVYCVINFSGYALIIFGVHLLIAWYFWRFVEKRNQHNWGVVYDVATRRSLGRAITRIFSTEYGQMLEFYVTDNSGRYGFLVSGGKYLVTAEKEGYDQAKSRVIDFAGKDESEMSVAEDLGLRAKAAATAAAVAQPESQVAADANNAPSQEPAAPAKKPTEGIFG